MTEWQIVKIALSVVVTVPKIAIIDSAKITK